ncbi:hypothetical protein AGRA3207_002020 [Actinomadura graeca]|uniref:Uncharacterized protein n=1 Tax=Actinomadura graeca TaxID=2750812 RepID=A0ABX8QQY7_9ACTN|nr:hypothetical protein [Actinomadura graeca]QXJ21190.1 hypothetical protein AGRA3207_002020 [Actinomadura graeca]
MGELRTPPAVAELDLRGAGAAQALKLLDELWENDGAPTGRILVTDETGLLMPHAEVFARLRSPLVRGLLCVAVGGVPGADGLEVPGPLLAGQDAGLLWVPDPDGHDWRPSGPVITARPHGPGPGLDRLRGLLRVPEVFDRTAELAAAVPGGVSNPGLRLASALPGDAEWASALMTAVSELLAPGPPPPPDIAPVDAAGGPGRPPEGGLPRASLGMAREVVRLRDESPLMQAGQRAEQAVTAARRAAARLGRPSSLLPYPRRTPAAEAAADAGRAVADLRAGWGRLFTEVPADTEPLPGQSRLIEDQGVLPPDGGPDPRRMHAAFGVYAAEALARGSSLAGLAEGLREQKGRLAPPRVDPGAELDRACPPRLVTRLCEGGPLPPPEPWLPLPGLVAAALAAQSAAGPAAGLVVAAVYTLLVGLTVVRGPRARLRDGLLPVAATGAVGSVGAVAGATVAKGMIAEVAAWLTPGLRTAAVAAALAVAAAAVPWSWRSRSRRWTRESGLDDAPAALADLRDTAARLASGWSRAARGRGGAADVIRATAALDGVREALRRHAGTHGAPCARESAQEGSAQNGRAREELLADVRGHLRRLVLLALEPCWGDPSAGMPHAHQDRARAETAGRIAAWERHVARHGALEPPPFAADAAPSGEDAAAPGAAGAGGPPLSEQDLVALGDAVTHGADAVMWQLLGPGDLPMTRSGDRPACVRFAPLAVRDALAGRCPADTLWVRPSRHAGVLRLVPVRPGLVRPRWSTDDEPWEAS